MELSSSEKVLTKSDILATVKCLIETWMMERLGLAMQRCPLKAQAARSDTGV